MYWQSFSIIFTGRLINSNLCQMPPFVIKLLRDQDYSVLPNRLKICTVLTNFNTASESIKRFKWKCAESQFVITGPRYPSFLESMVTIFFIFWAWLCYHLPKIKMSDYLPLSAFLRQGDDFSSIIIDRLDHSFLVMSLPYIRSQ